MTGTACAGGVGKCRALPGGDPTGAASRRLAAVPASRGPVVACRYAPTGTGIARQAAVDSGRPRRLRVVQHEGTATSTTHGHLLRPSACTPERYFRTCAATCQ